jgi:hypothetical protein
LDHIYNSHYSVAFGINHRLYDGWGRSYPAGRRHRRDPDPSYSGSKTIIALGILVGDGKVLGKEVVGRFGKDLTESDNTFS